MELKSLLEENREAILGRWFQLIAESYPEVTSEFLAKQRDRFRNPVGYTISQSIGSIYDQLISAMESDRILDALDGIIRIRSVQDFTPTETVAFVFQLKGVIRAVVDGRVQGAARWDGLTEVESRIDRIALLAFDKYTECRETLHRVRNREIQGRAMRALGRAGARSDVSRSEGETADDEA
jgi:hypothetical protein